MKIFLSICMVFFITPAIGQPGNSDNPDNLKVKLYELNVKTVPPAAFKLPFQSIKIIDSRPDTSKLGFRIHDRFLASYSFQKIILKPGIASGIENFYNDYYRNNFTPNGKVLLISMKRLWINTKPGRPVKSTRQDMERLSLLDIYTKFEYYFGAENNYLPLIRKDTIFQLPALKNVEEFNPDDENKLPFLCFALEKMIENVNYDLYIQDFETKKKMSLEDIGAYNSKSNNIPILNEPVRKGIFMTFDEFKNNRPSVESFSKRKMSKKKIDEIIDEKGNVVLHYFAYYDGKKLAMNKSLASLFAVSRSQYNFGIYRVGNSFQFFENQIENTMNNNNITTTGVNMPVRTPERNVFRVPRQIDVETGEIY